MSVQQNHGIPFVALLLSVPYQNKFYKGGDNELPYVDIVWQRMTTQRKDTMLSQFLEKFVSVMA